LIGKEFGIPVDVVKSWKMRKIKEYATFLEKYYKQKYGTSEDMDIPDVSTSRMPRMGRKHLPSSMRKGRGASGHSFKFA